MKIKKELFPLASTTYILSNNTKHRSSESIEAHARVVLEQSSDLSSNSIVSLMKSIKRLNNIDLNKIFSYASLSEFNDKRCLRLNALKKKSIEAFRPFISYSTRTLCHSMGSPLRAAEDAVEYKDNTAILNSLLKIVTLLSYQFALAASHALLSGECRYPEIPSFVFDEQTSTLSYRKEIAHMARYYRLHLASFIAIEFANELAAHPRTDDYKNNRFESVIELYEEGCADFMFNFVLYSNKREEKLVTPVLIDLEENDNRRKVLGIHIDGDEKIRLWKRWGDPYDRPMIINGEQDKNIIMEITPFSNALATI